MRGPGRGMGMRYGYGLGACADPEIQLKPDQEEKIKRLQQQYVRDLQELQRNYMQKRNELKLVNSDKTVAVQEIYRRQQELQVLREKMRDTWVNYSMDCQALLSEEQLELLYQIKKRSGHSYGRGR